MHIEPFHIAVPEADLADLHARLARTRLAPAIPGQGSSEGIDPALLAKLLAHWCDGFDWRAVEARLNRLPQYRARVQDHTIHFVHQRGAGPDPMPLVLTHGWPGSFLEMEAIIPLLADPGAHGADPRDSFHVVAPSLPGFGFSSQPTHTGTGPFETAGLWTELMTGLGYPRFGAQGGDIGAGVSAWLGQRFPEQIIGMHLNYIPGSFRPPLAEGEQLTDDEQDFLRRAADFLDREGAYARLQGTKPQSLAYAMQDNPLAQAAWIVERFHDWADLRGRPVQDVFGMDRLLTNIMIYVMNDAFTTAAWYYAGAQAEEVRKVPPGRRVEVPTAIARYPDPRNPMPPRSWVERGYAVSRWTDMPRGGHFAALEEPELFVEDLRAWARVG